MQTLRGAGTSAGTGGVPPRAVSTGWRRGSSGCAQACGGQPLVMRTEHYPVDSQPGCPDRSTWMHISRRKPTPVRATGASPHELHFRSVDTFNGQLLTKNVIMIDSTWQFASANFF